MADRQYISEKLRNATIFDVAPDPAIPSGRAERWQALGTLLRDMQINTWLGFRCQALNGKQLMQVIRQRKAQWSYLGHGENVRTQLQLRQMDDAVFVIKVRNVQ